MPQPVLRCVFESPAAPDLLRDALARLGLRPLALGRCPKRAVGWEQHLAEAARAELGDGAPDPEGVITAAELALADEDKVELWGALELGGRWVTRLAHPGLVQGDGGAVTDPPGLAPATRAALDLRLDEGALPPTLSLRLVREPEWTTLELRAAPGLAPVDRVARLRALADALEADERPFPGAAARYPARAALLATAERLGPHDAPLELPAAWARIEAATRELAAAGRYEAAVLAEPRSVATLDRLSQEWPRPDRWRAVASLAASPDEAWLDRLLAHADGDTTPALAAAVARRPPWPANVARLLPFAARPVGPVGVKARHALLRWGIAAYGPLQAALRESVWTPAQASALRKAAQGIDRGELGSEVEAPPLTCLELLRSESPWDVQAGLAWLGELGAPASEPTLRAVLALRARCEGPEAALARAVCVRTLAEVAPGHPDAQQAVLAGLEDPAREVRAFAIAAAVRLDLAPQELAGAILRGAGAEASDEALAAAAACSLRQLFGPDPRLRELCQASLQDETHPTIRSALRQALES